MRRWGTEWLVEGLNVYALPDELTVYPPHALVLLSPLGSLPATWAIPLWTMVNVGLALSAAYLAVRIVRRTATLSAAALPIMMFLCWGGFRTLLQFSLFTLVFGLLAMVLADRRPAWSGLSLGLALMKPQIAAPFFLWAVFARRLRLVSFATAVVALGFALFCVRAHANALDVARKYAENLQKMYTGEPIVVGLAQLRPVIALFSAHPAIADAVAATASLVLLGVVCVLATRERKTGGTMYSAPGLAGIWSLLTFYHLTYGFILLLPLAAAILFDDDCDTAMFRRRLFWVLQLALMVDVPNGWRRVGSLAAAVPPSINVVLTHFDRVLMLAMFTAVVTLAAKSRKPAATVDLSPV